MQKKNNSKNGFLYKWTHSIPSWVYQGLRTLKTLIPFFHYQFLLFQKKHTNTSSSKANSYLNLAFPIVSNLQQEM